MTWRTETGATVAERPSGNRPLTVIMVTRRCPLEIGGVERVVAALLTQVSRARPAWRVDAVSAFRYRSRIQGAHGLSDLISGLRLGWQLRRSPADVAFVHCPECMWGIRLLRRRTGGPLLVAVWHAVGPAAHLRPRGPGHPLAWARTRLRTAGERQALAADGHVAVRGRVAQELRSRYGLSRPVTVIANVVDPAIWRPAARPGHELGRAGLNVVWVGRAGYRQGLDVALAAVAEARRDLPGLLLTVIGVPPGKPAAGVAWLGVIPQARMAEVYGHADLLLWPARQESFGLVVIEAMAAGLPVIVSDAIDPGIVTDSRNGVVIAGHDPSRYAEALRLLADPAVRAAMAWANVEDSGRFSIEPAGADYAAVAESLAGIQ